MTWQSMKSFPKDGTYCDVLVQLKPEFGSTHPTVIAMNIKWVQKAIGKEYTYMGKENILSPVLEPLAWRKHHD